MRKQKADTWVGLTILIYASIIFWESISLDYNTKLGPGPGFFPTWVSGIIIILAIAYIAASVHKQGALFGDILPKGKDLVNNLSVICSVIVFIMILDTVGFIIASTILMLIILYRLYKWRLALGISLSVSVLLFLAFQYLLEIPLPIGTIFDW